MSTHSYSFNTDICLFMHSAECTVRLLKQAGIIIHTILNLWETPGIEPVTSGFDKCISNQQLYNLSYSTTLPGKPCTQCATGSKILTEPEPDRIGIILTGTGPDYKPKKVNRIRPDWPDFLNFNIQLTSQ